MMLFDAQKSIHAFLPLSILRIAAHPWAVGGQV